MLREMPFDERLHGNWKSNNETPVEIGQDYPNYW